MHAKGYVLAYSSLLRVGMDKLPWASPTEPTTLVR
jgi:hypothetical protein